ncbi:unnamed protein product [Rhizophagus irregularis]|nr:unnamed protein product [Rhizophagus irregularis]
MENTNTNDENFDPTPKLKSSPVPILFVSFNRNDYNCIYCGEEYYKALFCNLQKYCKKCLSYYFADINYNNLYLDIYLFTMNSKCSEHEISKIKELNNIQECCRNCFQILCFKQIPIYYLYCKISNPYYNLYNNVIESEVNCKLCGKLLQRLEKDQFKLCSDCYLVTSGHIESTLKNKDPIPVIYLPWWHNIARCDACKISLNFISKCQKYCINCYIFYIGCRYCLTTNVIFGPTIQSQCKKCKRVSSIIFDITKTSSGDSNLDDFLSNSRLDYYNNLKIDEFIDKIRNINTYFCPLLIFDSIYQDVKILMEWIPYSQFKNIKEIARGGFGIIYLAIWIDGSLNKLLNIRKRWENETVILKRFMNSQNISKYFLNELESNHYCYQIKHHVIRTYGFTKDPNLNDYILVIQYAPGGDLHNYLQKNFTEITWNKQKLAILWQISEGLETIHKAGFIHRDFHSGNILPEITEDTPKCYANLMKSCWDPVPEKRPSMAEIRAIIGKWFYRNMDLTQFNQAELKRRELIGLKKLGPNFVRISHPKAIYTSISLSFFISKCSSINFSKEYISMELDFDIDIERSKVLGTKRNIEELYIDDSHGNNDKYLLN